MGVLKEELVDQITDTLDQHGFETLQYEGCFDILGKKHKLLVIKALTNADSLSGEMAANIKIISHFLSAYALTVCLRNNHNDLSQNIIYSRFGIPAIRPELFEKLLSSEHIPSISALKGKHTVSINAELLRRERLKNKLSLESLGKIIGTSKKSLYEIEKERVNPVLETVQKLEKILGVSLILPYKLETPKIDHQIKPKTELQKKISLKFDELEINNSCLTSTLFQIIGKRTETMIIGVSDNEKDFIDRSEIMSNIASFTKTESLFITKKSENENINGIPVLLGSEILEASNFKDLKQMINEKKSA